jgi:hypothetical protein
MSNNKFAVGDPVQFRVYPEIDCVNGVLAPLANFEGNYTVKYYQMVNL